MGVSPFDSERVLGTLRFAKAKLDSAPATILIRADLGEASSHVLADYARVEIGIYKLDETSGTGFGTTPDLFRLFKTIRGLGEHEGMPQ